MDALGMQPPGELSFEGNVSENWRKWRRQFENYLIAINLIAGPADEDGNFPAGNTAIWQRQVAILLHTAGEEAAEIYDQFEFTAGQDKNRLPDVLEKYEGYCNPRRNLLYEWYVFMSMTQNEGESIDMFVKRLKTQAAKCEFGDKKEMMMLCRLVFGIKDTKLKERLLRDNNITLGRAMDDIRAAEVTRAQMSSMANGDKTVSHIARDEPSTDNAHTRISCKYCGYQHMKGKCPAYGQTCRKCGGRNHFQKKCSSKAVQEIRTEQSETEGTPGLRDLFIGAVGTGEKSKGNSWSMSAELDGRVTVDFKIDTGAEANIIPQRIAKTLKAAMKPSPTRLRGYNNAIIENVGRISVPLSLNDKKADVSFEVVADDLAPILGLATCLDFEIVKQVNELSSSILDEYPEVFAGLGCLNKAHEIQVDPSVRPVIHHARRIPINMMDRVKEELHTMEQNEIITRVDEPTDWVNSMVVVEKKNGAVRICLDPRDLNKAIKREHHHIPTLDDIAHRFNGMEHFTILDMKFGYWHIPLTEKSSMLTTFNTPFGRYRYLRLPFGINSAAEVFEKRVEQIFEGIPASVYFDDIIVAGRTKAEHDENLRKLLQRAKEANIRFNKDKVQLDRPEVSYLGHIISKEGLKPDPGKVKAIEMMPEPTDKLGIQRLLGTLNFLRPYLPNMSTLTEPLRSLLKDDVPWSWGHEQKEAMRKIKELLTSGPVLKFYDMNKDVTLQVDASESGLGAVIFQDNHPVAYASRSLSPAECNYPQIDKELLAIVFGCERFNHYVYGKPLAVQTDHQPLVAIVAKPLQKASPRLQRLLMRLHRYQIDKVTFVPGKHLYLADTLSRAYLPEAVPDQSDLDEVVAIHTVQITDAARERLLIAYQADTTMTLLKQALKTGWNWPKKKMAPLAIQPYWHVRDEIYESDQFLYMGERLLIPVSERQQSLQQVHEGHLGMDKCKDRARRSIYWPGMSADIEALVAECRVCNKFSRQQQKEPLMPHTLPTLPWNKVAMDICQFKNNNYLVVVDMYSHFPELRLMQKKTASDVIMGLKSMFAVHGVPKAIMADNMPFNSIQMEQFASEWGFEIVTSSPHYPRSNGLAERYVQTIKGFLKKAEEANQDVYASLLAYRETPVTGCQYSPAEMLFNRCIRGRLPLTETHLTPVVRNDVREQLIARQATAKQHHDRHALRQPLPELTAGQPVLTRIGTDKVWTPGRIASEHDSPRSYVVTQSESGQEVRRNRIHLRPDNTTPSTPRLDISSTDHQQATDDLDTTTRPIVDAVPHTPRRSSRANKGQPPSWLNDYDRD